MTDLPLTKIAETATTVTLAWTPVPCTGYVLYADGVRRSNSWDSGKRTWTTKKADDIRIVALGPEAVGLYPPIILPPSAQVLELEGIFTAVQFAQKLNAYTGPLLVRPVPGKLLAVTSTSETFGKDEYYIRPQTIYERIRFDGQAKTTKTNAYTVSDWVLRDCVFIDFCFDARPTEHVQSLFVGGECQNWLVEGCTFEYSKPLQSPPPGNYTGTAHIFCTSWNVGGPYRYPRNGKITGNTFGATHGAYFSVAMGDEIPVSAGICVQAGQPTVATLCNPMSFVGSCA